MILRREGHNIVTFEPQSPGEFEWLTDNTDAEPYQWLGQTLAVDTRLAGDLCDGAREAGWPIEF